MNSVAFQMKYVETKSWRCWQLPVSALKSMMKQNDSQSRSKAVVCGRWTLCIWHSHQQQRRISLVPATTNFYGRAKHFLA